MRAPPRNLPKVLFLDIETSFKIAGIWKRFKENISMDQLFQDTYVLSWAAKWLGQRGIMADALFLHPKAYRADATDDTAILKTVWKLLDKADYVVAHNGASFDVPTLNSRFIQAGLNPPSPYVVIDTLSIARRKFKFTSNRLGDIGQALKVGGKLKTDFSLWKHVVVDHNRAAFERMVNYNKRDVQLLESVYHKLKVWDNNHPNLHLDKDRPHCNACGSTNVKRNGTRMTAAGRYQQYQCLECGHWMRSNKMIKTQRPFTLRGA